MKRKIIGLALAASASIFAATAAAAGTLDDVKTKGFVQCGVSQGLIGFSNPDEANNWTGMDVDFCRAVAAAIFNDPSKVKFTPLTAKDRFTALQSGELITSVSFPTGAKAAYVKFKQPASRFALVGVFVSQGAGGVRVAVTGAKSNVFRCKPIEDALARSFTPAAAKAVKIGTEGINGDLHGTPSYRAAMISVMASRAVAAALAR